MYTLHAAFAALVLVVVPPTAAQTTAGSSTTIVVPITAQTSSFASEVTVYNPNGVAITVDVAFYEANNSATPGLKTCSDVVVPGNRSVQFSLFGQCTLSVASHFGLLVLTELVGTHPFHGYVRVQNPQGIGFSVEGFPAGNFNDQISHATGLKKTTGGLIFQTNCFVGSLSQPVSYVLKLFSDTTGAQIGSALAGSLNAFEQVRYLDVFGPAGVNAPNVDQLNVRAEFKSNPPATLIGFCTVQDNASFGADFRIAKSFGSPNAYVQGGNAFGATAVLGTTDANALDIRVNGSRVMRYDPNTISPNVIGGSVANNVTAGMRGATIAGGGAAANTDPDFGFLSANLVTDAYGTVGGGSANRAGNGSGTLIDAPFATVGGGRSNSASGGTSTIGGGSFNNASALAGTIGGGDGNSVSGGGGTIGGGQDNTAQGNFVVIGGGGDNNATAAISTIGGGRFNIASAIRSTVSGGQGNTASGSSSTVSGGQDNTSSGQFSVVSGGDANNASGDYSVALGRRAKALADGIFTFADSNDLDFNSSTPNSFRVRATGGVRFVVEIDGTGGTVTSCLLTAGTGSWSCSSDRNLKQNIVPLDGHAVLDRLVAMPIYAWSPKGSAAHVRHYGPMAQDFHAAYGLGDSAELIGQQDADGVALAAIQGLNAKLEQALAAKDRRIGELEARLTEVELLRAEMTAMRVALRSAMAAHAPSLPKVADATPGN